MLFLFSILERNMDKIYWCWLSSNPNAISLLENNPDKIYWNFLSRNPNAIHFLEQNPDKIDWSSLSGNSNAIHLLAKLDYEKMKDIMKDFNQELCAYVFHPNRLLRLSKKYDIEFVELLNIY
jgi:hypothetical protein